MEKLLEELLKFEDETDYMFAPISDAIDLLQNFDKYKDITDKLGTSSDWALRNFETIKLLAEGNWDDVWFVDDFMNADIENKEDYQRAIVDGVIYMVLQEDSTEMTMEDLYKELGIELSEVPGHCVEYLRSNNVNATQCIVDIYNQDFELESYVDMNNFQEYLMREFA